MSNKVAILSSTTLQHCHILARDARPHKSCVTNLATLITARVGLDQMAVEIIYQNRWLSWSSHEAESFKNSDDYDRRQKRSKDPTTITKLWLLLQSCNVFCCLISMSTCSGPLIKDVPRIDLLIHIGASTAEGLDTTYRFQDKPRLPAVLGLSHAEGEYTLDTDARIVKVDRLLLKKAKCCSHTGLTLITIAEQSQTDLWHLTARMSCPALTGVDRWYVDT